MYKNGTTRSLSFASSDSGDGVSQGDDKWRSDHELGGRDEGMLHGVQICQACPTA